MAQLHGWHASTYPSVAGAPVELAFFDYAKADAAIAAAVRFATVDNASAVHRFCVACSYRSGGPTPADDWLMRCVSRRGRFVEFVREDVHGNVVPGSRVKKQLREHTATNYLRGDYAQLDKHRRVYAADTVTE